MADFNGFILYLDQYEPISVLSLEQKGMLLEAMFAFHADKPYEIPDPVVKMAFGFFKAGFEREKRKHADICTRRKAAANSRWAAKASEDMQNMQMHASASDAMQTMPYQDQDQDQDKKNTSPDGEVVGSKQPPPPQDAAAPREPPIGDTGSGPLLEPEGKSSPAKDQLPPCPHQEIVAAYHECLPELARVKVWDGSRKAHLQARWRERWLARKYRSQPEGIAYWRTVFSHVHDNCDFLMGRITGSKGKPFRADLAWLVCPENFAKLIEGRYDNAREVA